MKTIQFIASILIAGVIIFALIKAWLRRKNQRPKKVEILTFSNTQLYDQCNGKNVDSGTVRFFYKGKHFTNRALVSEKSSYFDAKTVFIGVVDENKITSDTIATVALLIQACEALDLSFQENDANYMLSRHVD